jgi:hypothetical protein
MSQLELGQATIVYEDPEEGRIEKTLDNEQVVYVRDHWAIRSDTDEEGNDLMRQIPRDRVYYVERSVERFEEQASSVRHRIESLADDLRQRLPVSNEGRTGRSESEPITIEDSSDSKSSTHG